MSIIIVRIRGSNAILEGWYCGSRYMAAYAFYKRIVDLAKQNAADLAVLLGHVIAHEIAHLLLPYDHIPRMVSCVRNGTARNSTIWQKGC